jgi:hypothetical protein
LLTQRGRWRATALVAPSNVRPHMGISGSSVMFSISWVLSPDWMWTLGSEPFSDAWAFGRPHQPHIRSALLAPHPHSAFGGTGSGGRGPSSKRWVRPWTQPVRRPGSGGADQAPRDGKICWTGDQAGLRTAPSGTRPVLTYFHSATSSLRARATIMVLRPRPPAWRTRSTNHRLKAEFG